MTAFNEFVERVIARVQRMRLLTKLVILLAVLIALGLFLDWAWAQDAKNKAL